MLLVFQHAAMMRNISIWGRKERWRWFPWWWGGGLSDDKGLMIKMITASKMMIIMRTNLGQLDQRLLFLLTRGEQLPEKRFLNSSLPSDQDVQVSNSKFVIMISVMSLYFLRPKSWRIPASRTIVWQLSALCLTPHCCPHLRRKYDIWLRKIHFILEKKSSGTLKRDLCKDNIAQEVHVSGFVWRLSITSASRRWGNAHDWNMCATKHIIKS